MLIKGIVKGTQVGKEGHSLGSNQLGINTLYNAHVYCPDIRSNVVPRLQPNSPPVTTACFANVCLRF